MESFLPVIAFVIFISALTWFIKQVQLTDARIGEALARHQHAEPNPRGVVVFWLEPRGLFRYEPNHEFIPYAAPTATATDTRDTTINVNAQAVGVIRPPAYYHAVEVLSQTRRELGDNSDRIIPAQRFAGSPETWQAGVDYLKAHFGVIAETGRGTWCGNRFPTALALFRAATGNAPLPQA